MKKSQPLYISNGNFIHQRESSEKLERLLSTLNKT